MAKRKLHLLAYLKTGPTANHAGGWRHPESTLHDILEPSRYEQIAQVLEGACFDGCFFADLLGLYDIHRGSFATYIGKGGQISFLDPLMVLPLMARVTRHLGLGATISTTFNHPYTIARQLASLDIISKGRVAWNVVTSATNLEARNFGMDEIPPRDERYARADEVVEACFALWDCWGEDVFVHDKKNGVFGDPAKMRYANYRGKYVSTRGPLSIPRSPQGRPVIMQAGASPRGRDFAARWAEMIFAPSSREPDLKAFTADMHRRLVANGRRPEDCVIMPQMRVVVGETEAIAQEKAEYLQSLIDPDLALANNSSYLGIDLAQDGDEAALAAMQGNQGIQGTADKLRAIMAAENISLKEAAARVTNELVGTPQSIADRMQHLFESGACDGFVISPTYFPGSIEAFCRSVVPELQRRGIFRTRYEGRTLRENLRAG
ncbi:LLM class flavin-dependent oxidoreductase [Rhodoligotrophos defluvii]|uniref:LLM class flavin-dependent oxidoreductase n=1 Tax=Rhodoligotrophos defluvii TaxID=2561934 RepID=UPI0010C97139|nr:LLM class flavin-dependent oxidoreductase [Rhodoligotrophos defluvii]